MDAFQKYFEEIFEEYYDEDTDSVQPVEAWDAADLAALEIIVNAELQRRGYDQSVLG